MRKLLTYDYTHCFFDRVPWIQSIVVVVAKESLDLMMDIIHRFHHRNVLVVHGGSTRHRSIFNGVRALSEGEGGTDRVKPKVVIIHDAVRPFVEEDFLLKITMAAKEQGVCTYSKSSISSYATQSVELRRSDSLLSTVAMYTYCKP